MYLDNLQTEKLMYDLTDASDSLLTNVSDIEAKNASDILHSTTLDRQILYKMIRVIICTLINRYLKAGCLKNNNNNH